MKNVRLHGKLGKEFVSSIDLDVSTPAEALSALIANFPNIQKYFSDKEKEGVTYGIKNRSTNKFLTKDELTIGASGGLDICPVPAGSATLAMSFASSFVTSLISGYFQNMISKAFETDDTVLTAETNSYIYNGKENKYEQGSIVPLGYGRMLVGSNVISSSINNYDLNAETGAIYTLDVGAYTMLPNYGKWAEFYDTDLGPVQSSALMEVAEGYSRMRFGNPSYTSLKSSLSQTTFGSNDGLYGSEVITDGHSYVKKIGGGFFGSLTYQVIYNQGVAKAFLQNFTTNGNFTPDKWLAQWPDKNLERVPKAEKDALTPLRLGGGMAAYNERLTDLVKKYYNMPSWDGRFEPKKWVEERHLIRTSFCILQSEPRLETIDPKVEPRRFYPIAYKDGSIISDSGNPTMGTPITVGSRYIGGNKKNGLGWHKFESVAISKSIDMVCEGPIQGLCDADGNYLEFKDEKKAETDDDYLKGVLLDEYPVKEVKQLSSTQRQSVYNVNEFDIDIGRNEGGEIGGNDQNLLEKKYQFVSETKHVNGKLFGPHTLDADAAAAAAGSDISQWDPTKPFYPLRSYVTHVEEKYLCLRATDTVFNPLFNFIRDAFETPHIVVGDATVDPNTLEILSGKLYEATNFFVKDPDRFQTIGEFRHGVEYEPGDVVFERAQYLGDDPFGDDDKDGTPNSKDPDQMATDTAYWEAMGGAKNLKRWKQGDAYSVGDIVYESQVKAFKVIQSVPEWDPDAGLEPGSANGTPLPHRTPEDRDYFESASAKESGGFLAAVAKLDNTTFTPLDITPGSPGSDKYWNEIQSGPAPDNFMDAERQPLYYDPNGNGSTDDDFRSPVFKKIGGDDAELAFRPEEEYPINHIITNQLVDQALVTIQINQLNYLYPGDKIEVTYTPGALMIAALGAVAGIGLASELLAESDEPINITGYAAAAMWGGVIGYVIGKVLENNAEFKIGTKIDNSGETWPNKLRFRIKYGNEGSPLLETDVSFFGVTTAGYMKDIKIYLPDNPLGRTRIIKVYKISRERNAVKEGEQAFRYREDASFASVTEISSVKCSYPNSVVIGTRVNAKDMPNMPKRNYNLLLKKVKIPEGYDPIEKTYGEMWNGQFAAEPQWTDNPAWCLYDLLRHNSYGLGKYGLEEKYIDKWTFYRAAKYCDEIIPTGYSPAYKKRKFKYVNGTSLRIDRDTYDSAQDFTREFGHPGKKLAIFSKNIKGEIEYLVRTIRDISVVLSGQQKEFDVLFDEPLPGYRGPEQDAECCAEIHYPVLENRYRFNALLTSPQNAFKMIQEMANSFRAFTYWGGGKINFYLDEPKDPLLLFGNNSVTEEGFSYSSTPRHTRTNAIKTKYLDEHNAFKPKVEYVEDREKIIENGLYEQSKNSLGTTTKTQAHRVAEYTVQAANLETEMVSFTTSMPGSYLRPGDIIDVIDNKKTIGRFAGKVLNYDVSGDGKVGYLDIDFPVRTLIDEDNSDTFKTIKLYNISGYDTLETLNLKSEDGSAISDQEIKSIRAGHLDEFTVGSITNNDTRIEIINNPYSFVSGNFNWSEAVRDARVRGGELATINNDVDQRFVQTALPRERKAKAWIGGYYKEQPAPEEFVWLDPQACDFNKIDFYNWAEGYPALPDPMTTDNKDEITNDPTSVFDPEDFFPIAIDNLDLEKAQNFVSVSGSEDTADHADWITEDGLIRQGYILERRADDRLLRLNGIDGLTYLLEDEVNMAKPKQYRVVNIVEQGNHTYAIEGVEYSSGKFGSIENNETLPLPSSPIIYTTKTLSPPGNVTISLVEEEIELNRPYGIKVSWAHPVEDTIRGYKVQIFDEAELKKTLEVRKIGERNQSVLFRDESINEGGSYTARVETLQ